MKLGCPVVKFLVGQSESSMAGRGERDLFQIKQLSLFLSMEKKQASREIVMDRKIYKNLGSIDILIILINPITEIAIVLKVSRFSYLFY